MALDYKERRKKAKEESLEEKRSEKAWKSVDILGCSLQQALNQDGIWNLHNPLFQSLPQCLSLEMPFRDGLI